MKPFSEHEPVAQTRRHLPQWDQAGCTYFLTWRLADSLPAEKLREWQEARERWLAHHPEPWTPPVAAEYEREFVDRVERWLDAGHGSCVLRRADARGILERALHFFQGQRYTLEGCVIMPNHVHVLATPLAGWTRSSILQSWKGYSAREINRLLGQKGQVWQEESFSHLVRSAEQLEYFQGYVRENPGKARLREGEYYWWRSGSTGFPACERGGLAEGAKESEESQAGKPVLRSQPGKAGLP